MEFMELMLKEGAAQTASKEPQSLAYVETLDEAANYTPSTGNLSIVVIKPGWSKNNRYYPADVLDKSKHLFEGAKMFVNHATDSQDKSRPEGDVRDWVATITGVTSSRGTIKATANVHDPAFKESLSNLKKAGNLSQMGISIRAAGETKQGTAEGKSGQIVEAIHKCRSVDFVTFAAAGGKVEQMYESFNQQVEEPTHDRAKALVEKQNRIMADRELQLGKITEAQHHQLVTGKPVGYEQLTEHQKKEFDHARMFGFSEADAFKLAQIAGGTFFKEVSR